MDDDPEAPPADPMAERLALWHALYTPALARSVDLGPLLVAHWEHRAIWKAMRQVPSELIDAPGPCSTWFFMAWRNRLCAAECRQCEFWVPGRCAAHRMWMLLEDAREDEWKGVTVEMDTGLMVCALPHHGRHSRSAHTFEYWLNRLRAVSTARADISRAQKLAETAWHWYQTFDDKPVEDRSGMDELLEMIG